MNLDFDFLRVSPAVAVFVAAAVGAALGWVGPIRRRTVGLAVHGLFAALASLYAQHAGSTYAASLPPVEPNHVMGIVIAAVCLLGATTTFRFRGGLARNLASSASLLFTALIGLLAGSGELPLALGAAAVALTALAAPEPALRVERSTRRIRRNAPVNVTAPNSSLRLPSRP